MAFIFNTLVAMTLTVCVGVIPTSADEQPDRARAMHATTLNGVRIVPVSIEPMAPGVEKDGLSAFQLPADVEPRLRKAGLSVIPAAPNQTEYLVHARTGDARWHAPGQAWFGLAPAARF